MGMLWALALGLLSACGPGVKGRLGPQPQLEAVTTTFESVDGTMLRLQVSGSRFTHDCAVYWRGQSLPTTFVSETELTAVLSATTDIWSDDDDDITVRSAEGAVSSAWQLPHPRLVILAISPRTIQAKPEGPIRLTVTGRNFVTGTQASFDLSTYLTTVRSTDTLEVELPASALQSSGTPSLQLRTPWPICGGGMGPCDHILSDPYFVQVDPADPCQGGACEPPPPTCNASNCNGCCNGTTCVAVSSQSNGQCGRGGNSCGACGSSAPVCQAGACVSLCQRVTCNQSPASTCLDATTAQQYVTPGTCAPSTGTCSYSPQMVACADGQSCVNGVCATSSPPWSQAHPATVPSIRKDFATVYDSARQRVVLFGGFDVQQGQPLNDTWEWDGTNWEQKSPAIAPRSRAYHALAYDSARQRVVLFGGAERKSNSVYVDLNDTWEWAPQGSSD
ncbi:hypothetical protein D7V77_39905 [Corallococcus sp. CA041A]|uniref:kelch repeat-containing protein n=1 Tax=Corallococcus sp. CA041A TaxID=2316727 RepID=UPI000EA2C2D2|nr:kelch repeat-containing protein [Corallococcus sp. CA041A]RKH14236.1 hypothetical protein D7V77_39905 [Corallococcus sp. CA041A]